MTIQVRLFALMAQQARTGIFTLELPPASTAGGIKAEILRRHPKLPWPAGTMLAVNQEYAGEQTVLHDGDEVAVIPPVSGG